MLSIREDVFETNSSSCHSLTIARKSFLEDLKNKKKFFIGNFKVSSDSDEVFVNDLTDVTEKDYLTFEQVKEKIKEWLKQEHVDAYEKKCQEKISKLDLDNCTVKDIEDVYSDDIEDLIDCYLGVNCERSERFLSDDDCESTVLWKKEFPLGDGDSQVIALLDILC